MLLIDSWSNENITQESAEQQVSRLIQSLESEGVVAGNRVVLIVPSSSIWLLIQSALSKIGAVVVPIDPENNIELIEKIAVAQPHFILRLSNNDNDQAFTEYDRVASPLANIELLSHKQMQSLQDSEGAYQFMIFTSGTGGASKLAMLESDAVDRVVEFYVNEFAQYEFNNIIIALPLSAIYTICICLAAIKAGKTLVFVKPKEQDVFEIVKKYQVDLFPAVPIVVELIYKKINSTISQKSMFARALLGGLLSLSTQVRRFTGFNLGRVVFSSIHRNVGHSLKVILSGGAKIPKHVLYDMFGYGFTIYEGYGLTETTGVVTVRRGDYASIGSVGKAVNDVDISIGSDRSDSEVVLSTKQSFSGYFGKGSNIESNQPSLIETGDAGFLDHDGNLHINGRLKNVITFANEMKVSPEVLEELLQRTNCVDDPVIIGIDSKDTFGDHVVLFVEIGSDLQVRNEVDLDVINIDHIAPYIINEVVYIDSFPRNKLGKCCRNKLIEQYLGSKQ